MPLPLWASIMQSLLPPSSSVPRKTLYGYNARVFYEVFAVSANQEDGAVLLLPVWHLLAKQGVLPNETVRHSVEEKLCVSPSVVHSTSWRYEDASFLLTYLTVLPWQERFRSFSPQPIRDSVRVRGDHLYPPLHLSHEAVLTHALDHLALLLSRDESIALMIAPVWTSILETRLPAPAYAFLKGVSI